MNPLTTVKWPLIIGFVVAVAIAALIDGGLSFNTLTLASLTRTQGNVVMEAVISKDGTVEQLHVIKGHRLLRGAAKNAVRNWRYRPYKIGGVPVDVATTVSVDFSLHH